MRVFHLALALIFLGMVAIAGARVIGSTQPRPAIAAIFTNPDDSPCEMPCMFGIRPALTGMAEMLRIVGAHPMFNSLTRKESTAASGTEYQLSDQYQNIVIVLDTRNVVQSIHWQNRDCASRWRSTVGDVVNILGQPVAVQSFGLAPTTYIYLNFQIAIESNRGGTLGGCRSQNNADRLDPHYVVIGIFLEGPAYFQRYMTGKAWRGFRQAEFYFSQ